MKEAQQKLGRNTQVGQASPNPSYPQDIKNTGDSGTINEKVQNFNIWDEQWEQGYYDGSGNTATASTAIRCKNFISVKPNTQYYFYNGTNSSGRVNFYDKNQVLSSSNTTGVNTIKTTPADCYYIKFSTNTSYGGTYNNDICINVSNTALNGTYIPHAEQNISFPLQEGQKLMEGDYLADDGVHHVREQEILDGTQLLSKFLYNSNLSTENYSCFIYNNNRIAQPQNDTDIFVIADKLKGTGSNQRTTDMANCWINHLSSGQLGMHVPKSITTPSELRTYLQSNPITFQYKLAEEVIDPYTEEQQTVWEQIKTLRTYKGGTSINGDATVDIVYVRDLETVINNLS